MDPNAQRVVQHSRVTAQSRSWYSASDSRQKAAFWSSFAGHAADGMDTQMYSFVIPVLIGLWGLSNAEAGQIASVSLLTSALGGWGAGILADRFGRVRVLQWTILLFSVFSFASGISTNYGELFTARAFLGLGFGGETAISAVLIAESFQSNARGRAVGFVQGGWSIGWGLAAIISTICFSYFEPVVAWRVMFIIGATPAIIILLLRRHVSEPATFRRTKGGQVSAFSAIFSIFTRRYAARTALATLMCTGINGGFFAVMVWLPAYLKLVKGLSFVNTGAYLGVVICGSFTGYLFGSFLADAIGRKKTLALFALGALVTIFAYTRFELGHGYLVWIGFPLGLFTSGIFASIGSFLSELFPTTIRANAQGFSFNVGRGIGSVFPMLIGYASAKLSLGGAIGVFAATSYVLLFAALLILPETAGRELEES